MGNCPGAWAGTAASPRKAGSGSTALKAHLEDLLVVLLYSWMADTFVFSSEDNYVDSHNDHKVCTTKAKVSIIAETLHFLGVM